MCVGDRGIFGLIFFLWGYEGGCLWSDERKCYIMLFYWFEVLKENILFLEIY